MSQQYDITAENLRSQDFRPLHAGDDYDFQWTITWPGLEDLTGAKVWFTVKESSVEDDAEAKLQLTSDSSDEIEITDAAASELTVKFRGDAAQEIKRTRDLEGEWQYDMQVLLSSGKVVTVVRGVIEFLSNLTRSIT